MIKTQPKFPEDKVTSAYHGDLALSPGFIAVGFIPCKKMCRQFYDQIHEQGWSARRH